MPKNDVAQANHYYHGFNPLTPNLIVKPSYNEVNYGNDAQGTISYFDGFDFILWSVEPAHGTKGNDIIYLNGGSDLYDDSYQSGVFDENGLQSVRISSFEGGNDWIYAGTGNDEIAAGIGNDHVYGEIGSDKIAGGDGDDFLFGGDGEDFLGGSKGNDFLDGGPGNDVLGDVVENAQFDFVIRATGVHLDFADDGNDTMQGGSGEDQIYGGAGVDHLWGGPDSDTFMFRVIADNICQW